MQRPLFTTFAILVSTPIAFNHAAAQAQPPRAPAAAKSQLSSSATSLKVASPTLAANYGKLPLSFEANQGQTDSRVKFISRGSGYSLFLTDSAAVLELSKPDFSQRDNPRGAISAKTPLELAKRRERVPAKTDVVRMELAGATHNLRVVGDDQLPGKANYFIGKDSANWHTNVPTYAKVKYTSVYPGVDLIYYGNQRQLEYDFVVAPGANPSKVKLRFAGASKLQVNADGDLSVVAANGEIAFHKPVVYQDKDGRREPVEGKFTLLAKNTIGFQLGGYDHTRQLIIDPVLAYSTYLGGTYSIYQGGTIGNVGRSIAVDKQGNAYIYGTTASPNFPVTASAFQKISSGITPNYNTAIFVTKLNAAGSALIYSTYLSSGVGHAIAVDADGDAYLAGESYSDDYPVIPVPSQTIFGNDGAFVTKLNAAGSGLIYSTYVGGDALIDSIGAIAVDSSGDAYVSGGLQLNGLQVTPGAFETTSRGYFNTFVMKLNPAGTDLVYSTYTGGVSGSDESCYPSSLGLAVDSLGEAYVVGSTDSTTLPVTPDAFQTTNNEVGPNCTAFVMKLNAAGSAQVYSTYLGGTHSFEESPQGGDFGQAIAVDSEGDAYVGGFTTAIDFPGVSCDEVDTGSGFLSKLNPTGSSLIYSTCPSFEGGLSVAVDSSGDAYMAGGSYVIGMSPTGSEQIFYLSDYEFPLSIFSAAVDGLGNLYLTGYSGPGLATTAGAFQSTNPDRGAYNAFVTKYAFHGATTTSLSSSSTSVEVGAPITFTASTAPAAGSGTPSGTVSFIVDSAIVAHANLDGSGQASYTDSSLAVGQHSIVASYEGDPSAYSASSGALTETIIGGQVATPTIAPLTGTYRNATVSISTATQGASIYYTTDGTPPSVSSTKYVAPFAVTSTQTVRAIAAATGDTPSAPASATYTISPSLIPTATTMVASTQELDAGQSVTFTATVQTASGPTPTGSITFQHGFTTMAIVPLTGNTASFSTSTLPPDGYSITAFYTGSATNDASQSAPILVYVNP